MWNATFKENQRTPETVICAKSSGSDVIFALDPKTSMWAKAGFTDDSNWWVWDLLGYAPSDADSLVSPELNGVTVFAAAREPGYNKPGWDKLDTSSVTDMRGWFAFTSSFNQPIGSWDTGCVKRMDRMFMRADNFDQSLAGWDISRVKNMSEMFWGCGISILNLSDTLVGWAHTAHTKGVKKNVLLTRLPYKIHDLTEKAQEAICYLRVCHRWQIGSNYIMGFACPENRPHCDCYKRRSKRAFRR